MPVSLSPSALLFARLSSMAALGDHEWRKLRGLDLRRPEVWRPNTCLPVRERAPETAHLIISGWAGRIRTLRDGRRQIINILLPGDFVEVSHAAPARAVTRVSAFTLLSTIPAHDFLNEWRAPSREPALAAALDLIAAEDEYFLHNQIVRLGRQLAFERVANLFMELDHRLSSRGLSHSGSFLFPLTQEAISAVVGLSVVHVNRTLQQMRRDGHISLTAGHIKLLNKEALSQAGEFIAPGHPKSVSAS